MILKNNKGIGVDPFQMLEAVSDMVKMYKQIHMEALKVYPEKESYEVATNIIKAIISMSTGNIKS